MCFRSDRIVDRSLGGLWIDCPDFRLDGVQGLANRDQQSRHLGPLRNDCLQDDLMRLDLCLGDCFR